MQLTVSKIKKENLYKQCIYNLCSTAGGLYIITGKALPLGLRIVAFRKGQKLCTNFRKKIWVGDLHKKGFDVSTSNYQVTVI